MHMKVNKQERTTKMVLQLKPEKSAQKGKQLTIPANMQPRLHKSKE